MSSPQCPSAAGSPTPLPLPSYRLPPELTRPMCTPVTHPKPTPLPHQVESTRKLCTVVIIQWLHPSSPFLATGEGLLCNDPHLSTSRPRPPLVPPSHICTMSLTHVQSRLVQSLDEYVGFTFSLPYVLKSFHLKKLNLQCPNLPLL